MDVKSLRVDTAFKALESFESLIYDAEEMLEILREYETTEELLENEADRIDRIMDQYSEIYPVKRFLEAEQELEEAYESADWS